MNMSANPDHPFHVAVGNNKVLRDDPKERGLDLYEEMLKFYHEFYSANGMTLCVIGKESIAELEAMIRDKFSDVPNKELELPLGDDVSPHPPFLPQDWNQLLRQCPVKDVKQLTFSWVLPFQGFLWRTKPTAYASHLLGHEGRGSLAAVLKERGLITRCTSSGGAWLEGAFSLMHLTFDLTDDGVNAVQEIGSLLFAYIRLFQGVQGWILDEMKNLSEMKFKFGEDCGPFALAASIAKSLQLHPPSEVLAGVALLYEQDVGAVADICGRLRVDNVRVTHQAKVLEDLCTDKDTSYDSPIKFEPLDAAWVADWTQALEAGPTEGSKLALPERNPFIPEDFSLRDLREPQPLPARLQVNGPIPYLFHRQDDVFRQPKALVIFYIRCPFVVKNATNFVKANMWSDAVCESLNEYAYDAQIAEVGYNLGLSSGGLKLVFLGFHDKLGRLIEEVAKRMLEFDSVPETIWQIVSTSTGDHLRNANFHTRPISQCALRSSELLTRGGSFPVEAQLEAFQEIRRESMANINKELLEDCHVEAVVLGNNVPDDARAYADILSRTLNLKRTLTELPVQAEAICPPGSTVWSIDSSDKDDPNHAVRMSMQFPRNLNDAAALLVVTKVLSPKFFDSLRTQQQLGYIVGLGSQTTMCFNYLVAQVQTEYSPDYTRGRIDAFLHENLAWMQDGLSEQEFETCRNGVLSELKTKPKNLVEEHSRYNTELQHRTYDFERRDKLIALLDVMKIDTFLAFVVKMSCAPRLYVQVHRVLAKDDKPLPDGASTPEDPATLRRWFGPDVTQGSAELEWVEMNRKID